MDDVEQEGRYAFRSGKTVHDCPYSFNKTKFWPKDYVGFEKEMRHKLNAWMKGWIEEKASSVTKP